MAEFQEAEGSKREASAEGQVAARSPAEVRTQAEEPEGGNRAVPAAGTGAAEDSSQYVLVRCACTCGVVSCSCADVRV